ncbi:hypothetical protein EVAR_68177_1 [Eumeta japonica]|uniref:Uncharacterized protein n=1 Tax=Eumeta variegata TaxID=151549 RepID=A0A4C2A1R8_EUMVA|nr:hypothetical protein EVAR_68177_1 [Eumeta japonica]
MRPTRNRNENSQSRVAPSVFYERDVNANEDPYKPIRFPDIEAPLKTRKFKWRKRKTLIIAERVNTGAAAAAGGPAEARRRSRARYCGRAARSFCFSARFQRRVLF